MLITVYCSGGIAKGPAEAAKSQWTDVERSAIMHAASPYRVRFLRPDDPFAAMEDSVAMFGRDMYQVQAADFVVVDARARRGIGIGVEILASRIFCRPLIIVLPPNSHYRQKELQFRGGIVHDYIHPHLSVLADAIVDDFDSAGRWMREFFHKPRHVKCLDDVQEAILAYKQRVLHLDEPMLQLKLELESSGKSLP